MLNYMICAAVVCVLFLGIVYLSLLLQQHMLEEASDKKAVRESIRKGSGKKKTVKKEQKGEDGGKKGDKKV